jgi:hypothetical protein
VTESAQAAEAGKAFPPLPLKRRGIHGLEPILVKGVRTELAFRQKYATLLDIVR